MFVFKEFYFITEAQIKTISTPVLLARCMKYPRLEGTALQKRQREGFLIQHIGPKGKKIK